MPKTNSTQGADATAYDPSNPLIVQSDRSLLLEVHNPLYDAARAAISPFAELEKSPEHIHTYRLTPLSLWNAAATGLSAETMCAALARFAKYPVPQNVLSDIADLAGRWGRVRLRKQDGELRLEAEDAALLAEIARHKSVKPYLGEQLSPRVFKVPLQFRGALKQALIAVSWPVEDLAGYATGEALELDLRADNFTLRDYQQDAAQNFYAVGSERGGSGVIVLPCGAGKTIVGMAAMALLGQSTLILTTSRTSMQQWRRELLDKTSLQADQIVEYQSDEKRIGPVTLTTYQMLTWRPDKTEDFPHLRLFEAHNWGLIIYDEVHMLPAPVFRITAEVQARRRLGLTATLIREDGREGDVFSLIGPKKYEEV
jgi:DNA excision repair protein ERCC-3